MVAFCSSSSRSDGSGVLGSRTNWGNAMEAASLFHALATFGAWSSPILRLFPVSAVAFVSGFAKMPCSQQARSFHMAMQVCMGAMMMCTMGMAPSSLVVLPTNMVFHSEMTDSNIMDNIPMVNMRPLGGCISPGSPMGAAATAAAMGDLTPMPCIPMTV